MKLGTATLFTAAFLGAMAAASADTALRLPSQTDPAALGLDPLRTIDYGSYRWWIVADEDAARLAASGRADLLVRDAGQVRVPGYVFDPLREGEPQLAPAQRAQPGDAGLQLVQLVGPPKRDWYAALEGTGVQVLQYYPHNSYLVWSEGGASARLEALPFVRWVGAFHPAYKLGSTLGQARTDGSGRIQNLVAFVYTGGEIQALASRLAATAGELVRTSKASADGSFETVELRAHAAAIPALARDPNVIWLGYRSPRPVLDDEMSDQIVAGNHPGGAPVLGYAAHLATLGVDGSGVIWAISDTGVDWDHPDLASHIVGGFTPATGANCTIAGQPGSDCPNGGHGTHVAGIVAGDATAGFADGAGFLYGLGVAPETSIFAINIFADISLQENTKVAVLGGAIGSNNSWSTTGLAGVGYTADARLEDILVRDGNLDTATVAEPFIQVFSAGNSGSGASTITEPKEAKNIISVANSLNARAGSIDSLSGGSSRGPAIDGRKLPTLASPGSLIASTRNDTGGSCASAIAGTSNRYSLCSGTSMASPHAAGSVVLAAQWWRSTHSGSDPSPAMAKALLVNGAVDMGAADIPNNNEGWGRANITRTIQPATAAIYTDQTIVFTATGQQVVFNYGVDDPAEPLRITVAWSDAPGAPGANPALVNDLDLVVEHAGASYRGNVFAAGTSTTGGAADALNNLENVYIAAPVAGGVKIVLSSTSIAGDGVPYNAVPTDQDFALVCSNCVPALFVDGFESSDTGAWSLAVP
jgi:subtilisin family serine protease